MARAGSPLAGPSRAALRAAGILFAVLAVLVSGVARVESSAVAAEPRAGRVAVPKLPAAQPVDDALRLLRRSGFRAAVIRADGYPKARPGHVFVAAGWAVERRTTVRRRGSRRSTVRVRYADVRAGARRAAGTRIHVRPRQVPVAAGQAGALPPVPAVPAGASATPAAPAPGQGQAATAQSSSASAAAAVNAGSTPVVSGPPATGAGVGPDAAPPAPVVAGPQGTADPVTPPAPAPPTPGAGSPVDLATATARFLSENTVRLPFMDGCTGLLVRDPDGRAIGAVSAIHCRLQTTPRTTSASGEQSMVVPGPLDVLNADDLGGMRSVGTAASVTLPPATDRTHDLALISFSGSRVAAVRAAYEAMRLAPSEAGRGRTVMLSAFPLVQPLNVGAMRRQVMTGTVLGRAPILTSAGRTIPTIWTAMTANADGAVCSYGASGGAAVTTDLAPDTGRPVFRVLGVLGGYDDYRAAGQNTAGYDGPRVRLERQAQTGFNLAAADATCNYAYELPDPGSAQTVRLVARP